MLSRLLDPVQRCCCTPGGRAQWARGRTAFDGDLLEEINLSEAQRGLGLPGAPVEVRINSARERAGFRCSPPAGPRERAVPTFATADVKAFRGEPIRAGKILQLTPGESIHEMELVLYANGFSLMPCDGSAPGSPRPVSRAWSPFSLVEKCQVKTMRHSSFWAVFKLTVFRREGQDWCYYFATTGDDAYKERDRWVAEMAEAIGSVTVSLFPRRAITVQPLPQVEWTLSRIMAGYLLQSGAADSVSLYYCELQAYSHGRARLAIYQDEWCEQEVGSAMLADSSTVSTRNGAHCTVFGVDNRRFCARTREEKELWVRAISNVKVKLMFDAPDPTHEELRVFRAAVRERLGEVGAGVAEGAGDPLLARVPRMPPFSPRGDSLEPEPAEEDVSDPPSPGSDDVSIEDIDDPSSPWMDLSPPCSAKAYCASPQAVADESLGLAPPPVPEVLAGAARAPEVAVAPNGGEQNMSGPLTSPHGLCDHGCLEPSGEQVKAHHVDGPVRMHADATFLAYPL